jgi:hypothetical protein
MIHKTLHNKQKIEQDKPHKKLGVSGFPSKRVATELRVSSG